MSKGGLHPKLRFRSDIGFDRPIWRRPFIPTLSNPNIKMDMHLA